MRRRTLLIGGGLAVAGGSGLWWQRSSLLRGVSPPPSPLPDPWPSALRAQRIEVRKAARRLALWADGRVVLESQVALGFDPLGHKQREGDGRTPEGRYPIDFKNEHSRFYLSLRVGYPNAADRAHAQAAGVPPGGDIMIHGQPNWVDLEPDAALPGDWTLGCIAVSNSVMTRLFQAVELGCPIEIFA